MVGQYDGKQFAGADAPAVDDNAAQCDRDKYAERSDLNLLFGSDNISKWADLNNNEDAGEIQSRVCWALAESAVYFDDELSGGPYVVPFSEPFPAQIVSMSARYAGVLLYDSRGIPDAGEGNTRNVLAYHRDLVSKFLSRVLAHKTKLTGQVATVSYPASVK